MWYLSNESNLPTFGGSCILLLVQIVEPQAEANNRLMCCFPLPIIKKILGVTSILVQIQSKNKCAKFFFSFCYYFIILFLILTQRRGGKDCWYPGRQQLAWRCSQTALLLSSSCWPGCRWRSCCRCCPGSASSPSTSCEKCTKKLAHFLTSFWIFSLLVEVAGSEVLHLHLLGQCVAVLQKGAKLLSLLPLMFVQL